MTDTVDVLTRSRNMSNIRGKDTGPERLLRRALHARGFRFRLHGSTLPGKPDLVFRRYRAVCFVHGCFWHRHAGCRYAATPASNTDYWLPKLERNAARDVENREQLLALGWRVAIVWECALRRGGEVKASSDLGDWLRGSSAVHESAALAVPRDGVAEPAHAASS